MHQLGRVRLMDATLEFGQQIEGQLELAQYLEVVLFAGSASSRTELSHLARGQRCATGCCIRYLVVSRGTLREFPFGLLQFSGGCHRLLQLQDELFDVVEAVVQHRDVRFVSGNLLLWFRLLVIVFTYLIDVCSRAGLRASKPKGAKKALADRRLIMFLVHRLQPRCA